MLEPVVVTTLFEMITEVVFDKLFILALPMFRELEVNTLFPIVKELEVNTLL